MKKLILILLLSPLLSFSQLSIQYDTLVMQLTNQGKPFLDTEEEKKKAVLFMVNDTMWFDQEELDHITNFVNRHCIEKNAAQYRECIDDAKFMFLTKVYFTVDKKYSAYYDY